MTSAIRKHARDLFLRSGPASMWSYLLQLVGIGIISNTDASACATDIRRTSAL